MQQSDLVNDSVSYFLPDQCRKSYLAQLQIKDRSEKDFLLNPKYKGKYEFFRFTKVSDNDPGPKFAQQHNPYFVIKYTLELTCIIDNNSSAKH